MQCSIKAQDHTVLVFNLRVRNYSNGQKTSGLAKKTVYDIWDWLMKMEYNEYHEGFIDVAKNDMYWVRRKV